MRSVGRMKVICLALSMCLFAACGSTAPHTVKNGDVCEQDSDCLAGSCCACTNCDAPALPPHHACTPLQNGACPKAG